MLLSNQRLPFQSTQRERQILLHPETIRSILRFTHAGTMWQVPRLQNTAQSAMGTQILARESRVQTKLFHYFNLQRRTQPVIPREKTLRKFHEKVKKEIRAIKSLLKTNTKGAI